MSLLNYGQNERHMGELKRNINNIVPFFGAGASMPYGYPSWSELMLKVLTSIREVSDMTEPTYQKIKDSIKEGHYMSATEEMYKCWPNLENYVCEEISAIKQTNGSCLEEYIHLFPSNLYLTTNYDDVLEKILRRYFSSLDVMIPTSPTTSIGLKSGKEPTRKEQTLFYLHGKSTDPSTIIFSEGDYNDFYGFPDVMNIRSIIRRLLAGKLYEIYSRAPLLFIGCGMNIGEDKILRLLKRFNYLGPQPSNFSYALLNAKGLTSDQINSKVNELLAIKVHPIWYENDHEEAKKELFEYILGEKRKEFEDSLEEKEKEYEMKRKNLEEKEKELKKLKREIEESSEIQDKYKYSQKYHSTNYDYEFVLVLIKENNQYYLSDQGRTYEMLDKVFELKEPEVIKNLNAIAKECKVQFIGGKLLVVPLESWNDLSEEERKQLIEEAKCRLFTCVSFMDKMRIFYV